MNTSVFFKSRIPLYLTALLIALYLYVKHNSHQQDSVIAPTYLRTEKSIKTKPKFKKDKTPTKYNKLSTTKKIVSVPQKTTSLKNSSKYELCSFEFDNNLIPQITSIIFKDSKLTLHKYDSKLASLLTSIQNTSKATMKNVEFIHKIAEIYYMRAELLNKIQNNPHIKISFQLPFELPKNTQDLNSLKKQYAQKAIRYFSMVRALPKYKLWSLALYEKASALILTNNLPEAVTTLKIVARTRSQSQAANYSRLSLGLFYFNNQNYQKAFFYFNNLKKIKKQDQLFVTYLKKTAEIFKYPTFNKVKIAEFAKNISTKSSFYKVKLRDLSYYCAKQNPNECISTVYKNLPPPFKKNFISWMYKVFKTNNNKKQIQSLCRIYGEKK